MKGQTAVKVCQRTVSWFLIFIYIALSWRRAVSLSTEALEDRKALKGAKCVDGSKTGFPSVAKLILIIQIWF